MCQTKTGGFSSSNNYLLSLKNILQRQSWFWKKKCVVCTYERVFWDVFESPAFLGECLLFWTPLFSLLFFSQLVFFVSLLYIRIKYINYIPPIHKMTTAVTKNNQISNRFLKEKRVIQQLTNKDALIDAFISLYNNATKCQRKSFQDSRNKFLQLCKLCLW